MMAIKKYFTKEARAEALRTNSRSYHERKRGHSVIRLTEKERFLDKIKKHDSGCWIWTGTILKSGYGNFGVKNKVELAHRVSWRLFRSDIPIGLCVCHTCDIRSCVNPKHLFVGSQQDNMRDAARKGRIIIPARSYESNENHQVSKLKNYQVLEIRSSSLGLTSLAETYSVCPATIWKAKTKRTFRGI